MKLSTVKGNIVDPVKGEIYPGEISISAGKIKRIQSIGVSPDESLPYILPGFIDAHVHVESSMLVPSEFARAAVTHGTIACVSDPHEIANVMGIEGIEFMIENASRTSFNFFFGAPSCVPATDFETSGASISANDIEYLFKNHGLLYLSEMMNYPGVLLDLPEVSEKLALARKYTRPIDGHAPGLRGDATIKYTSAGITTDHECYTIEEAEEKAALGMKILIREGSAAKNFNALHPLIKKYPSMCMFCSDDKHPDDLMQGHINLTVKRALELGYDLFDVIRCASLNAKNHYCLDVGMLQRNDYADFIVVNNLEDIEIQQVFLRGILAFDSGESLLSKHKVTPINNFHAEKVKADDFKIKASKGKIRVIEALEGELITNCILEEPLIKDGYAEADLDRDILKLALVNRYKKEAPAKAFIKNFGLKEGAIASSVAHDSHNIIAVGTSDKAIATAINAVVRHKGGLASVDDKDNIKILPLPVAGLMSALTADETAKLYEDLDLAAKQLGSKLNAPFMTLSFMALLVIPELKLSDKGLFDGNKFQLVDIFADNEG